MSENRRVPKYRRHKPTGQAVVTLSGKDHYLGKWNTAASKAEYDRLIGEWLAAGRCLPRTTPDVTVAELAFRYWEFAQSYYVQDGRPSGAIPGIKVALRILRQTYGQTLAAQFGPLALESLQVKMVAAGQSRRYVNDNVDRIRRVFRWGVAKELVPPAVDQALRTVPGLRRGRTDAREPDPIGPVADEAVEGTLPHLPVVVADMVRFQRLTGARPGEVCHLRPCDVDRSKDVWEYRPTTHKTQYRGRQRVIYIGPKAQTVLRPYLLRDTQANCFQPAESEQKRREEMRAKRKTKVQPSQWNRCKRRPKRIPKTAYTKDSYNRAIARAIDKGNRERRKEAADMGVDPLLLPHWHPNQLRHSKATEVRQRFGLEAAQVVLGHARADVTQVYAERDTALAAEVMRKIG
jgi:integrase